MGFFFGRRKNDEYDEIYHGNNMDYEEVDENEDEEEAIERLRGTIGRGDCIICDAHDAMVYDGCCCFICKKCGGSVSEDTYLRWAAGYSVEFED